MGTFKILFISVVAGPMLALGAACTTPAPRLEAHFGDAVAAANVRQCLDPDARLSTRSVAGLDGEAANSALVRYYKSFVAPPPPGNVFTIGVSGASGAAGAASR